MTTPQRVPAGTPTGGRFAPNARAEADVELAPVTPEDEAVPVRDTDPAWSQAGIDPVNARQWIERGKTPEQALDWEAHGFDPVTSVSWERNGFGPDKAAFWQRNMFDARDAREWTEQGMPPPPEHDEEMLAALHPDPMDT